MTIELTDTRGGAADETDTVIIVGAGPVGCTLALELAQHGIRSLIVERATSPTRHPKMDYVNARSMELLHRLGLGEELRAEGVPSEQPFRFLWTRSFAETPVADWSSESVDDLVERMATINDGSLPRHPYLRVIGARLEQRARGACRAHRLIDLLEGAAFERVEQDELGVTAIVQTDDGEARLRCRFLVGCDGANSAVRSAVDIPADEIGPVSQNCNVYFRSSDPRLLQHGRFFLAVTGSGVTLVSRDGADTWTGVFPLRDGKPFEGDPIPVLRAQLGIDFEVDELLSVANWENRLAVARKYRRGRVFIAGDAAHQFFPSGGHGANTGIGDAVDLGWKLAGVLNGWAGQDLLESYEQERRPVALFNREMCFNLMEVWRRFIFLNRDGSSKAKLAGYLEHQSFHANNLGIHLGYRYAGSAVLASDSSPEPTWHSHRYVPSTWPGSRVPSIRTAAGREIYDQLGTGFTLIDFSTEGTGKPFIGAASKLGLPLRWLRVSDAHVAKVYERQLVLVRPDHYVAWRSDGAPADPTTVLSHAVARSAAT